MSFIQNLNSSSTFPIIFIKKCDRTQIRNTKELQAKKLKMWTAKTNAPDSNKQYHAAQGWLLWTIFEILKLDLIFIND